MGNNLEERIFFGCKDYLKNFRPEKVKMIKKVLRDCVVCQSNKSRFLKQKNKLTINFTIIRWRLIE